MNWVRRSTGRKRVWATALIGAVLGHAGAPAMGAVSDLPAGSASGLPVPRFVSIKADRVNVRAGPTRDHDVTWVYTRAGLPVEIIAEFENWRRIRDWEGAEGWVYHSLLSGKRTAIVVAPAKASADFVLLLAKAAADAGVAAKLQPGVLGIVKSCGGRWCRLVGSGFDGWIAQDRLWGVYPNEKVE
ncbi:MAG: aspartyl-trna synthetase [Proteobacteria bacterium]|nr:aspartyl-trna synthetase [Pseudomonadota bacterium]